MNSFSAKNLVWFPLFTIFLNCSAETNLNKVFVAQNEDEAVDYLLSKATLYFDKGDFTKAEGYINKAFELNPANEEVAIAKGYINLSQAGVGIFELSQKLISLSDDDTSLTESNALFLAAESSSSTTEFLEKLGTLITDQTEIEKLKGTEVEGVGLFSGLDYSPPLSSIESRLQGVTVVDKSNAAINVVCGFVNDDAKILGLTEDEVADPRHSTDVCPQALTPAKNNAKVHFIWALAHLMEATAFNLVVLPVLTTLESQAAYASKPPNTSLENDQVVTIAGSIEAFSTLAGTIDAVLPSGEGSENSMLLGMLNDLDATAKGFGQIAGIPKELISKLTESISSFRNSQSKFQKAGQFKGASSLKDQLVSKVSSSMKKYLENPPTGFDSTQKTDACKSLKSVSSTEYDVLVASGKCSAGL